MRLLCLATIATLFGMQPADVEHCRVLEIGCASGGNLIPMAELLPESRFLGIDASGRQLEQGQKIIEELGFTNVRLQKLDIRDINLTLGQFDYIICHGVFSWVPRPVQDKILAICRDHLAPHGVAYVSYNTYPGWHMRGMIRDMMGYHAKRFAEPAQRVAQARALLGFMAQAVAGQQTAFNVLLQAELQALGQASDSYLFHEQLEENNDPLYFHEFIQRAAAKGLQYLGEAEISAMWLGNLPQPIAATLRGLSADLVQMEQYMDFLRNRMFRQTLLCHKSLKIDRSLKPEHLKGKYIAANLTPVSQPLNVAASAIEDFRSASGATISTPDRIMKGALVHLALNQAIPAGRFPGLAVVARGRAGLGGGASLHGRLVELGVGHASRSWGLGVSWAPERPDSGFNAAAVNAAAAALTDPTGGRRWAARDSTPASGRSIAARYARSGKGFA